MTDLASPFRNSMTRVPFARQLSVSTCASEKWLYKSMEKQLNKEAKTQPATKQACVAPEVAEQQRFQLCHEWCMAI